MPRKPKILSLHAVWAQVGPWSFDRRGEVLQLEQGRDHSYDLAVQIACPGVIHTFEVTLIAPDETVAQRTVVGALQGPKVEWLREAVSLRSSVLGRHTLRFAGDHRTLFHVEVDVVPPLPRGQ